jgi:hypothetical protein
MKNLVILISSGGSNMAALARAARQDDWERRLGARIAAVISNRPDAPGLDLARELGLPAEVVDHQRFEGREAFDAALAGAIDLHQPALVVLAGFMRILTPGFVAHYAGLKAGRTLNLPVIATYHTLFEEYLQHYAPFLPSDWLRRQARALSRRQCNQLDAVVVPSTAMRCSSR